MQARVTVRSASVGSTIRASGTFSTRTSPAPYMTVARMLLQGDDGIGAHVLNQPSHPPFINGCRVHAVRSAPSQRRSCVRTQGPGYAPEGTAAAVASVTCDALHGRN